VTKWACRRRARAPVPLGQCRTIDLPYVADAEIVLEGEILPIAGPSRRPLRRVHGPDGGLHWNPTSHHHAIMMRKGPDLLRPAHAVENTWLAARRATRRSAARCAPPAYR